MTSKESDIQSAIINALMVHPSVAFARVTTNGTAKYGRKRYKLGDPGQLDIVGMRRDGKYFAIEVKKPGGKPTAEQLDEIEFVKKNNGVAGWADNATDALLIVEGRK